MTPSNVDAASKIKQKGIYRDPVRSSQAYFVKVVALRWLGVLAGVLPLS